MSFEKDDIKVQFGRFAMNDDCEDGIEIVAVISLCNVSKMLMMCFAGAVTRLDVQDMVGRKTL